MCIYVSLHICIYVYSPTREFECRRCGWKSLHSWGWGEFIYICMFVWSYLCICMSIFLYLCSALQRVTVVLQCVTVWHNMSQIASVVALHTYIDINTYTHIYTYMHICSRASCSVCCNNTTCHSPPLLLLCTRLGPAAPSDVVVHSLTAHLSCFSAHLYIYIYINVHIYILGLAALCDVMIQYVTAHLCCCCAHFWG